MRDDGRATRHDLLTVSDAVSESRLSEDTIRRHIAKGALPVVRVGPFQRIRIRRQDFDRYVGCPPAD